MSAVTLATSDGQIYRFGSLEEAEEFRKSGGLSMARRHVPRTKNAPRILAFLSAVGSADAGTIADALETTAESINPMLRSLAIEGSVVIVAVAEHNRRIYAVGSPDTAPHAISPHRVTKSEQLIAWARGAGAGATFSALDVQIAINVCQETGGKLLRRLEKKGAIERCGKLPGKGGPLLYRLTPADREG